LGFNRGMAERKPIGTGDVTAILEAHRKTTLLRRRRVAAASAAFVVLVSLVLWRRSGDDDGGAAFRTQAAVTDRLVVTVNATGTLQPTNQVEVGSELSGIVDTVFVDFNDRVERGQVLARLDTLKLSAEALQSKARLVAAEAALQERRASAVEAEAALRRMESVRKASGGRVPSRQDYDAASAAAARARALVASAQAEIEVARAKLDFDSTNLAKAEIRSPIDGVVLSREVEPGQTIAASLQAPKLFTLAEDLAQMELEVDVDEADVGQVREGQQATFTVDAYAERSFPARITQLRYASETVNGVVSYKAVLQVGNADLALRPGMTATADIVVATVEGALLVPNEALRFVPPVERRDERGLLQKLMPFGRRFSEAVPSLPRSGKRRTVYRLEAGRPVPVEIEVGLTDGRRTEVTGGGLDAGSEVVVDAVVTGPS
jgi:HlyD family secretion protein